MHERGERVRHRGRGERVIEEQPREPQRLLAELDPHRGLRRSAMVAFVKRLDNISKSRYTHGEGASTMSIAAGYARVSTEGQVEHGWGLPEQQAKIEEHCRRRQYELAEVVADAGVS